MTKRTEEIEAGILAGFANGRSLRAMCREFGISRSAFLKWKQSDPDVLYRYEDAMLLHAEALIDNCLAIGDDPEVDLGEGGPAARGLDRAEVYRYGRYRIAARLRIARIYMKRCEAIEARRAAEEAALVKAEEAEEAAEAAAQRAKVADEAAETRKVAEVKEPLAAEAQRAKEVAPARSVAAQLERMYARAAGPP